MEERFLEKPIEPLHVMRQCLVLSMGLDRYAIIMRKVRNVNVSKNRDFQRIFNGFYGIRRKECWREIYYNLFEQMKTKQTAYEEILEEMYRLTGNIESSFSSKMYATLYPDKPILDRYVLKNLGLKLPAASKENRLQIVAEVYHDIERWYTDFLKTENAKECLKIFNKILPEYSWLSDVKKVDFYLWSIR